METELPNAKGESDEPGMKLDGVESENTEAIELLNNIVKSGSLTSMQNKIEEILAICQNQSQKQFQNDIMEESTNTVIMVSDILFSDHSQIVSSFQIAVWFAHFLVLFGPGSMNKCYLWDYCQIMA